MPQSNTLLTLLADVSVPFEAPTVADVTALGEPELLGLQRTLAEVRRRVDTASAAVAAEVARRSHFSLGHAGLAQRLGARTPQALVQRLTGSTAREAAALVRVGTLLAADSAHAGRGVDSGLASSVNSGAGAITGATDDELTNTADAPACPWLADVVAAVASAQLSVEAADVIRAGLGEPDSTESADTGSDANAGMIVGADAGSDVDAVAGAIAGAVTIEQLRKAAWQLVVDAATCSVEQLAVRARHARALLDAEADASRALDRERGMRDRRYLYLSRQPDGMTRLSGLLDPESAALVSAAVDAATSPRRGGPRFVSAGEIDRAERIVRDERSTEQIAADTLVELVRLGGQVAPTELLGARPPSVQVIVTERDLASRTGLARIEGQSESVSVATAERHVCESGVVPIVINDCGDVVALGRQSRLYTARQRVALAARDGGCRFPECSRPPSWAEAHHITPWSEGGSTDLASGVLLCRHHHMLLHNNGWRFTRVNGELAVVPPRSLDPEQRPIPAPSKNPLIDYARQLAGTG